MNTDFGEYSGVIRAGVLTTNARGCSVSSDELQDSHEVPWPGMSHPGATSQAPEASIQS